MDNTIKNTLSVILIVLLFYIVSALSSILIPLVFALLLSIAFQPFVSYLIKKKIPIVIVLPTIIIISLSVIFILSLLLIYSYSQVKEELPEIITSFNLKMLAFFDFFNDNFGDLTDTRIDTSFFLSYFNKDVITSFISLVVKEVGSLTTSFIMFALYFIVFLTTIANYKEFLTFVENKKDSHNFVIVFEAIQQSVSSYLKIKFIVSFITGIIVYAVCTLFGLKFAILWAFFSFTLNFIPTIGAIVAVSLPTLLALIQFDSPWNGIFLFLILLVIKNLLGNLIEPIITGNKLHLNTITVIFGLIFWGFLWGIPGMFLSVPMLVIIKLIFEQIPSISFISRLMS
ncbi:MAG TPA: AI-2E family transporter [Candidatus Kapabacteria bacterium]|nr:AI-2E family transporter [Candidatus Kapabacteria bacterium]HPO61804.1 AI-2E family transporter [Candidatus Kapabacteria bacterium]